MQTGLAKVAWLKLLPGLGFPWLGSDSLSVLSRAKVRTDSYPVEAVPGRGQKCRGADLTTLQRQLYSLLTPHTASASLMTTSRSQGYSGGCVLFATRLHQTSV